MQNHRLLQESVKQQIESQLNFLLHKRTYSPRKVGILSLLQSSPVHIGFFFGVVVPSSCTTTRIDDA